jgi:hypothetical protein
MPSRAQNRTSPAAATTQNVLAACRSREPCKAAARQSPQSRSWEPRPRTRPAGIPLLARGRLDVCGTLSPATATVVRATLDRTARLSRPARPAPLAPRRPPRSARPPPLSARPPPSRAASDLSGGGPSFFDAESFTVGAGRSTAFLRPAEAVPRFDVDCFAPARGRLDLEAAGFPAAVAVAFFCGAAAFFREGVASVASFRDGASVVCETAFFRRGTGGFLARLELGSGAVPLGAAAFAGGARSGGGAESPRTLDSVRRAGDSFRRAGDSVPLPSRSPGVGPATAAVAAAARVLGLSKRSAGWSAVARAITAWSEAAWPGATVSARIAPSVKTRLR